MTMAAAVGVPSECSLLLLLRRRRRLVAVLAASRLP
jgi:hypothetical protein